MDSPLSHPQALFFFVQSFPVVRCKMCCFFLHFFSQLSRGTRARQEGILQTRRCALADAGRSSTHREMTAYPIVSCCTALGLKQKITSFLCGFGRLVLRKFSAQNCIAGKQTNVERNVKFKLYVFVNLGGPYLHCFP